MKRTTEYLIQAYHPTKQDIWCKFVLHLKRKRQVLKAMDKLTEQGYNEFSVLRNTYIRVGTEYQSHSGYYEY